ncbi:hypothetical protein MKX01_021919 [Papaver californicum]|nr:hypothetical protein MKX01_021919 [Papaver californicum]
MLVRKKSVGDLKEADYEERKVKAVVPTIQYLIRHGAKVILCSHLGRPEGVTPRYSLKPLVPRLSELIQINLASLADLYVNDAFRTSHQSHLSIKKVTKFLSPCVELDYLVGAMTSPRFVAIVFGSKLSSEIGVIVSLLGKVGALIIGGQMAFTFMRALNHSVGTSPVEEDKLDLAKSLVWRALARKVDFVLPTDVIVADKFALDANSKKLGLADQISHILPRGDAYKDLLEGKSLPGIRALDDTSAYYL